MTTIAAVAPMLVLLVGAIAVILEAGYSFDLRAKSHRHAGGRRANDQA